ncbi:MAG: hypothetical protein IJI54_09765 [Kiritimatiellae bacterium]|nr:hypothetical protein [Kiritimatiellia bacterium]
MKKVKHLVMYGGIVMLAALCVSFACGGCASHVAISGREDSTVVLTNAYASVRYDGCFWKNDLWEPDWNSKKSRRHTLKIVRVKIYPWQAVMSVMTLGVWVPMYIDWELNGDYK